MSSTEAINNFVEGYAQLFKTGQRSPILRRPDEYGMEYEDILFPSLDGTVMQGWFIPALNSQKLIIANHPMTCNRYEFPGHLEEYGGFAAAWAENATIHAMTHFPEYFKAMKAMILLQAVSGHAFVEQGAINPGLDKETTVAAFDKRIHELTGFWLAELTPLPLAKNVTVPTLFAQVRRDTLIDTSDSQQIFDALGSKEKKMVWIEDTDRRFDGYNYFAKEPVEMLNWFKLYI
ncbi:hypothetical protein HZS61_011752 [Fusarium oxysporum f. sp. conglutinans]|uniref:Uncharacterized protein n=2 Tax=Fusarium oxysporum f. sp. conglutinans TaxID=100902 RepID=A0A8H6LCD6_FUSOX|nr:hypothetical protein FOXB_00279 [Fusarium oxysporum f. sp. conglutinans Fo5176]KAF6513961.1 hypothetical protein HZS61_006217 [Fusarium oxysporum f. sp. conglutinans]KAF6523253.1 hypothetical protein HZS61_011752 [Fusarium oxysporum f. sp. conglutinans]KAG6978619.1 hypothetical protein FocnCong_v011551 [Fusarium oxysporum f. sp. conglutinans]